MSIFAGIEGGGTTSQLVLVDENGKRLAESVGGCTNYWSIGLDACLKEILKMIESAKNSASEHLTSATIRGLGMSLSGGGVGNMERMLAEALRPHVAVEKVIICNDTVGSLYTINASGSGIVLIAGTGSNCALTYTKRVEEKETTETIFCGGWGNQLGDEGSAYWISWNAIVSVLRQWDAYYVAYDSERRTDRAADGEVCNERCNFAEFDKAFVEQAVRTHFELEQSTTWHDIIPHFYAKFDKARIADLCKQLAQGAIENGDPLCLALFAAAGRHLAKHVLAVLSKAESAFFDQVATTSPAETGDNTSKTGAICVPVLCVGSVLLCSWALLRASFVSEFGDGLRRLRAATRCIRSDNLRHVSALRLLKLRKDASHGAAYMAARACNLQLPITFEDNYEVLDTVQFDH